MWIGLVCLYGVLKGVRDIIKKKAMEKNSAMEVLFFYTFISFLFVTPSVTNALFSLYRICNDKISYNFYSLDMQF